MGGIYIPNIEKPKFCKDGENICFAWDDEKYKCRVTEWKKPCPLIKIDLVRCGECKYFNLNEWDETICGVPIIVAHEICHKWGDDGHQTSKDGFCFMGERRTDEHTDKRDGEAYIL